ncbi:Tudor domain-containing protein 7 [Lucilia cuprina]|nr:Tudor domain-containing protein 7 [Lucilia cuprina]
MSNNSTKQQELKHIGSIVRALVTSRKPPCYLRDILREYPEVESKPLPFKSMGYKTAQELLEDTGEFIFNSYGNGDVIITAKYSKNSAHITSMVRGQKSSKSTRIAPVKAMKQPSRMPSRSNGFGDRNNNNYTNNRTTGSSSSTQQQRNYNNQPQNQTQSLQRQKSMGSTSNNPPAKDLREMLNSKKNLKTNLQQSKPNTTAQQSPLASKVIQPQQGKVQQQQQQKQSAGGPRPILGAAKQQQQQQPQNRESQNAADHKKTEVKSQPQQKPTNGPSTANNKKVENSSSASTLKPQQRLNAIQNNQQQQTQQQTKTNPAAAVVQQPQTLAVKTANVAASSSTQKPLTYNNVQGNSSFKAMEQMKSNAAGIQNRLKVHVKPEYQTQPITYNHQFSNAPPKIDYNAFPHHQFSNQPPKMDAIASIIQYCRSKNYPAPRFNVLKDKFSRGTYSCSVHINDIIFSTYPHEYETEYLAKEACAKRALEKTKMLEKKRPLPTCALTDTELLDKLYTELLNHPHGIFAKNLPETFETTFQQQLPDNWWALVQTSSLFTTETNLGKVIIFANKDADKDTLALCTGEATKTIQIDPIRLPWSDEYWNVFITHCTSTVEVWGRLFGQEYNVRFSALVNDIEAYMATKKERPVSIARKNIYLVHINECWHRVRVDELDKSKGSALCFFIDFGDADWLAVDQLHICETHFLRLPAQAVPFSLYGLEDFEGNPYARKCLDDLLPTKSLVGRIFTKESEFYDTNSKSHGKIQLVLFDTSTQEDLNLNHQLLNTICSETMVPEIKQSTVTNVIVTHITDQGDIYLQVNNAELKYVQKLLQQIVESKLNSDQHKISFEDLKRSNLFLICDDEDATNIKWYRAALTDSNIQPGSDSYEMYYVDNGRTKLTNISKIFLLDSLSMALSKFPAQAIKVRLHNIPDITANIVGRIRGLLPSDCEALVRLSVPGSTPPLVTIYTRLEGPGTLCTINDVIRIEHELEGCSDLLQGCALDETNTTNKSNQDVGKKLSHSTSGSSLASPTTPTSNPFIDVTRGLTLTKIPGSPQKSSDLPKLQNYAAIPKINEYFEVRITMSANPSNFTIQPYKDYPNLRGLMKELQEFCENSDEFIPTDMVEIGEAYAAKNPDGFFHRVTVVKKYGDMMHVSFCDFGDIATLDSSQLKTLPLKFRQLPKMAIQAKLYGIKAVNGDWTLDDCLFFRKLTVGKTFVSVIKDIKYDKDCTPATPILELELIDVTTDDDILIHELLLNEKRAINE